MILAQNVHISEGFKENQNIMVVGVPGSGKTRSLVIPHLMETDKSCMVLDPKGEIYNITHRYLENKGFKVILLDFVNPKKSPNRYNPFDAIKTEEDIITFTNILLAKEKESSRDVFWPATSQILANALVGVTINGFVKEERNFKTLSELLAMFDDYDNIENSSIDTFFKIFDERFPENFATQQYKIIKNVSTSEKTLASIVISLAAVFSEMLTEDIKQFTAASDFDFRMLGKEKTVLFVKSSDTDRSKDFLVNMLFQQAFDSLCKYADTCSGGVLPVHVHFILDDFGTNLKIDRFDSLLAGCRSREISCTVILQSIGQLKRMYGESWTTILGSCRSYVFLGSNDIETCQDISLRLDKPLGDILYKDKGTVFIFTQGSKPITAKRCDITKHKEYKMLDDYGSEVKAILVERIVDRIRNQF